MVGVLDSNETCWFLVSHKKGTQDDTALAHKPAGWMYNTIYNTSYLLNIQDYWTCCNHIFTSGIISARKPTPHQPPRAHPNFPHPTASQIATPFRNCHRGEWSRTLVLQFKSKGATYLKSENGVMRRASCLRHFSFFSDEHGNVLGFDLLSNTPTVCVEWPLIAMSVPNTIFLRGWATKASKLRQSNESHPLDVHFPNKILCHVIGVDPSPYFKAPNSSSPDNHTYVHLWPEWYQL